jgi:UDP-N-acetylmuramoyl-tripeptide--D-alanyl-D-alanine ligase
MGSLLGVAVTKGAICRAAGRWRGRDQCDDAYGRWFEQHFAGTPPRCRVLRYGLEHTADVTARDIRAGAQGSQFTLVAPSGEARVVLGLPGRHNVSKRWPPPAWRWPPVSIWR